jgi:hypothetical protein
MEQQNNRPGRQRSDDARAGQDHPDQPPQAEGSSKGGHSTGGERSSSGSNYGDWRRNEAGRPGGPDGPRRSGQKQGGSDAADNSDPVRNSEVSPDGNPGDDGSDGDGHALRRVGGSSTTRPSTRTPSLKAASRMLEVEISTKSGSSIGRTSDAESSPHVKL